ncbi:uncharacterized protein A4U43_C04F34310 [Asparagus officinalis]|uniref:Uncharacterized protein n=1 Tax=Asparagus officinalis TaxID=4686 RepID=A0A5P1F5N6_ASPOF|nr:uncharacterized protein A4U43_C04F34310 [Asparagus officinalis]
MPASVRRCPLRGDPPLRQASPLAVCSHSSPVDRAPPLRRPRFRRRPVAPAPPAANLRPPPARDRHARPVKPSSVQRSAHWRPSRARLAGHAVSPAASDHPPAAPPFALPSRLRAAIRRYAILSLGMEQGHRRFPRRFNEGHDQAAAQDPRRRKVSIIGDIKSEILTKKINKSEIPHHHIPPHSLNLDKGKEK